MVGGACPFGNACEARISNRRSSEIPISDDSDVFPGDSLDASVCSAGGGELPIDEAESDTITKLPVTLGADGLGIPNLGPKLLKLPLLSPLGWSAFGAL